MMASYTLRRALRAALAALVTIPARAQFSGLSATDDGSRVYFASPLRLRGTDQALVSKIFRIDGSGATLAAGPASSSGPIGQLELSGVDRPQVTGDGRLLLYHTTLPCPFPAGSTCFLSDFNSTFLLDTTTGQESGAGMYARISRNGRYLATYSAGFLYSAGLTPSFQLIDRSTNTTLFQASLPPGTVSIASDGTTVIAGFELRLVRAGKLTTLAATNVGAAAIDDGATTMVYESGKRLYVMDLKSSQTQELGPGDRDSFQATLSADGQWVAYLSTLGTITQVFYSRLNGTNWKQLTAGSVGIVEATLSGDGKTVFAITGDGSMMRIDTTTGNATTLVGPTAHLSSVQATTPGSLASISGSGLGSASITIAGLAAPILQQSASGILFQVPWETPLTADSVTVPEGGNPYFDDSVPLPIAAFSPQPIYLAPGDPKTGPIAIHTDWASLVTTQSPAVPGETVHIYLTGGGPVSPPVGTGMPAPIQPLSPITTPVYVSTDDNSPAPLQVPYFGLAPGLVGIWQMDLTIPVGWSRPLLYIQIGFGQTYGVGFGAIPVKTGSIPVVLPPPSSGPFGQNAAKLP